MPKFIKEDLKGEKLVISFQAAGILFSKKIFEKVGPFVISFKIDFGSKFSKFSLEVSSLRAHACEATCERM